MFITDPQLPIKDKIKLLDTRESRILEDIKNLDFSLKIVNLKGVRIGD